ncbi:type II toxin-antitoxin system PemK/MazF family toxin [Nostocaceae cyanobacterium CENA369]|uniref:mRNA interferase n=1 Tax=Dendronalium phyllosphericum CENA369 TaxID=1725256 RepID=A0A8J7I4M0_9NOST|nr:type II toxin-antitoxin system PemK/MazF family toxin [Dendronalium phyllosphericum]MBH8572886.1 type II toxin-antitoxin system PemK/MazF family toxin [Dendronalium phyllosphericum CENA369]
MTLERGEIWLANLNPTKGYEQGETRPIIIFQNEVFSQFSTTVITILLTTNLRRASLPTCFLITAIERVIERDSVALCYQLGVIDRARLQGKLGKLSLEIMTNLEGKVLLTLGYKF